MLAPAPDLAAYFRASMSSTEDFCGWSRTVGKALDPRSSDGAWTPNLQVRVPANGYSLDDDPTTEFAFARARHEIPVTGGECLAVVPGRSADGAKIAPGAPLSAAWTAASPDVLHVTCRNLLHSRCEQYPGHALEALRSCGSALRETQSKEQYFLVRPKATPSPTWASRFREEAVGP
jgi:hypothetical protein